MRAQSRQDALEDLALVFGAAALVHGYEHTNARNAESVIASVLLLGLLSGLMAPERLRAIGLSVQGFALLGTCVGLFTIAIGVGPRTALDLLLHASMVTLLVGGLLFARTGGKKARPVVPQGAGRSVTGRLVEPGAGNGDFAPPRVSPSSSTSTEEYA